MQSSQVQQMVTGSPNWWSISNMRPRPMAVPPPIQQSPFLAPPSNIFPQYNPNSSTIPVVSSWNENIPESWSQLLMSGLVGEEEKCGVNHYEAKKLENWEDHHDQLVLHQPPNVKQENSGGGGGGGYVYASHEEFQAPPKSTWSPKSSCVTTFSSNMLDFSNSMPLHGRHPPPDHSSECDSSVTGGALKKARVQASSTQSTFKVRKEKLGDRITALHQLVSPFGKTDTASVLLEAIGYIRFLQSQIEALSVPYLTSGSGNMRQQPSVQGERNCIFPEDPGQLLNDHCMKNKGTSHEQNPNEEAKKDLRSRGLCLVPVSCTPQLGSDNGADYWAPALGAGFR